MAAMGQTVAPGSRALSVRSLCLVALVTVWLFASAVPGAAERKTDDPCANAPTSMLFEYWERLALGGEVIREAEDGVCYRSPWGGVWKVSAEELAMPQLQDIERRWRIQALLRLLHSSMGGGAGKQVYLDKWDADPDALVRRAGIERMTRQHFESAQEARTWWEENRYFLRLRSDTWQMLVDEVAKADGQYILDNLTTLPAKQCWSNLALGYLRGLNAQGEYFLYEGLTSPPEHGGAVVKAPLGEMADEAGHLMVFLSVAEYWIAELRKEEHRADSRDAREWSRVTAARLRYFCGENLATSDEWSAWWEAYRDALVVSEDGTRLVTQERAEACTAREPATAAEYWRDLAWGGEFVEETPAGVCYRTFGGRFRRVPAKELIATGVGDADETAQAMVLTQLLSEWIASMGKDRDPRWGPTAITRGQWDGDPKVLHERERVYALTGQRFETPEAAQAWWEEHRYYLRLNPDTGQLLVDEDAKAQGEYAVESVPAVAVRSYWRGMARQTIDRIGARGGYLLFRWTVDEPLVRGHVRRVRLIETQAPAPHLLGFLDGLDSLIDELRPRYDPEPIPGARDTVERLEVLHQLTGRSFSSIEDWRPWYDANKDRLVLSEDGTRLVLSTESEE